MDKGAMGLANIELPKKVKYAPHKKKADGGSKMDLAGRTYADRSPWPGDLKLLTVQIDCVEGLRRNSKCILALHFARLFFQLYILLEKKDQAYVKAALDAVEAYCEGSFSDALPVMLGDRSSELLDFAKIETGFDGRVAPGCSTATRSSPARRGAARRTTWS